MPQLTAFLRQVVKETERVVSYFFKGGEMEEVGTHLENPVTFLEQDHGSGNGLRYGLGAMQGWRVEMEDTHCTASCLPAPLGAWSFFAIFDGHGGSRVARYCSEHLLGQVVSNWGAEEGGRPSVERVKSGTRAGFLQIDSRMQRHWRRSGGRCGGSTAVAVTVSPTHLYFVNCGDSRAVLCRGGSTRFYTEDHKPSLPREHERIRRAGGTVTLQRVNGSLAVSRALGDFSFKAAEERGQTEQLVSPEPEVYEIERSDEDQFVILACDGVWDIISNEDLCQFVCSRLQLTENLEDVCSQVINVCLYKGSRDNMSIILVCFPNAPKVSEEAMRREEELDMSIKQRAIENFNQQLEEGEPSLFYLMQSLALEEIPNLPPGGGLSSK
ncbi:protein phosphatase 1B-like [Carcharodon carcharias]|uniref:protein phosphatase 1B-like n=1 Tax=Carcharodon carcharias TaxID=13397 RepID=UPI001B7E0387|nr:protein phosphatase 1B-like [Carcharodon carcharias]